MWLSKLKIQAQGSLTHWSLDFQLKLVNPPNLLPFEVSTKTIVEPLLSQYLWKSSFVFVSDVGEYNNLKCLSLPFDIKENNSWKSSSFFNIFPEVPYKFNVFLDSSFSNLFSKEIILSVKLLILFSKRAISSDCPLGVGGLLFIGSIFRLI